VTDTVLLLAWLVLAHLVADFVLQNDWIAMNKARAGRRGTAALGVHGLHVGLCLVPVAFAFGLPGVAFVAVVVISHMAVDQWKVGATGRAERAALEGARRRQDGPGEAPASGLGNAWTPWPGLLFLADQALHLGITFIAWLVILGGAELRVPFVDLVNQLLRDWDRQTVHAVVLTGVVLLSLFLVNTRGAYYFVLALVSPRQVPSASSAAPEESPASVPGVVPAVVPSIVPTGASARTGTTIAGLERLLIVTLVLAGAVAAVGLVMLVDVIARFRQLQDRGYAEYYLLGALGGASVAVSSALLGLAALRTLG
jgi:hypothetical protein